MFQVFPIEELDHWSKTSPAKTTQKRNHNSTVQAQAQENHPPIVQCTYKFQFGDSMVFQCIYLINKCLTVPTHNITCIYLHCIFLNQNKYYQCEDQLHFIIKKDI